MSFLSEHVIPGNYGKIFSTDAKKEKNLLKIQEALLQLHGIKEVIINQNIFPYELEIHTSKVVKIEDIEKTVKNVGFHAISKGSIFALL
jgi:hypothetical protein